MSGSFEKREKSFEAKWVHDEELRFKTYARRNKLLGLWAAAEMGIIGPAADAYAKNSGTAMPTVKEFLCPARRTVTQVQAKRDFGYAMSLGNGTTGPSVLDNIDPV